MRLCSRTFATTVWAHDALRTAPPPDVRAMAPARTGGNYNSIQFSCGGMVVERHDSLGMRRYLRLEAFGENTSLQYRMSANSTGRIQEEQCSRRGVMPAERRLPCW